jgi:hypothetical protein
VRGIRPPCPDGKISVSLAHDDLDVTDTLAAFAAVIGIIRRDRAG